MFLCCPAVLLSWWLLFQDYWRSDSVTYRCILGLFSESQITLKERRKPKPHRSSKTLSAFPSPVLTCCSDLYLGCVLYQVGNTTNVSVNCFISRMGINHLIWRSRRRTVDVLVFFKSMNPIHPKRSKTCPNSSIVRIFVVVIWVNYQASRSNRSVQWKSKIIQCFIYHLWKESLLYYRIYCLLSSNPVWTVHEWQFVQSRNFSAYSPWSRTTEQHTSVLFQQH